MQQAHITLRRSLCHNNPDANGQKLDFEAWPNNILHFLGWSSFPSLVVIIAFVYFCCDLLTVFLSMMMLLDFLFKYLVIGSAGTGKSCILHQFIENKCKYRYTALLVDEVTENYPTCFRLVIWLESNISM